MSRPSSESTPSDTDAMLASTLLRIRSNGKGPGPSGGDSSSNKDVKKANSELKPKPVPGILPAAYLAPRRASLCSPVAIQHQNLLLTSHFGQTRQNLGLLELRAAPLQQLLSTAASPYAEHRSPELGPGGLSKGALSKQGKEEGASPIKEVRREQVQAALQSKPQRGRKRNNLSEAERLELTRTRNREHAKSTRNRKKARYEELVDKEAQLQAILDDKALDSSRRAAVIEFLTVHELMARSHSVGGSNEAYAQVIAGNSEDLRYEAMGEFEVELVHRTVESFGAKTASLLSYSVNRADIALNLADTALMEVTVKLAGQTNIKLITAQLIVKFAPKSNKITEVKWHSIKDHFDDVSVDGLCQQTSHPSVVSLDRGHGHDVLSNHKASEADSKRKAVESEGGPGMDI